MKPTEPKEAERRGHKQIPWPRIEGVKKFAAETDYPLPWVKAVLATPEGAGALYRNIVDSLKFVKASNKLLNSASDLPKGFATWKEFREMNEARIAEVKKNEAQKSVMLTSEVKRQVGEGVGMMFNEIDRRDRELPPALAGRSSVEVSERLLAETKTIKKILEQKFKEIGE